MIKLANEATRHTVLWYEQSNDNALQYCGDNDNQKNDNE